MQKYSTEAKYHKKVSKPGAFVLPFPEVFGLGVCSGFCSVLVVMFFVFVSVCVTFTFTVYILPSAGCTVPVAVTFPVIAKREKPGVCAVK
jgi:hypothetical protein